MAACDECGRLVVVSWNVNSLGSKSQALGGGSVAGLATRLGQELGQEVEILCLQETLAVDREQALPDGWDSVFQTRADGKGQAGVATYWRTKAAGGQAVPLAAEIGFSGLGCCGPAQWAPQGCPAERPYAAHGAGGDLDSEGRVVITDHGAFVLFNVYAHTIGRDTSVERATRKLRFLQALSQRWEHFLQAGRRVLVVGDLNTHVSPLDASRAVSFNRADRKWLRTLLGVGQAQQESQTERAEAQEAAGSSTSSSSNGSSSSSNGSSSSSSSSSSRAGAAAADPGEEDARGAVGRFADVFRALHPGRRAYTRYDTSGAVGDGSRIDLALAAGLPVGAPLAAAWGPAAGAELASQGQAERLGSSSSSGGGSKQEAAPGCVWVSRCDILHAMHASRLQGSSDHAPLWLEVCSAGGPFPCAERPPPCSVRAVRGAMQAAGQHTKATSQTLIASFFGSPGRPAAGKGGKRPDGGSGVGAGGKRPKP